MVIERVWRTIGESAIAMLLTAELSESYWEEARKTACYVYNRSPGAHEDVSPISPYQQYYGIVPHVSHLQIFGTKCYVKNPVKDKGNHEQKAWPGIFVGYQDQQPIGWRVYLPESDDFLITAHATFEDHRVSKPSTEIGVGICGGSSRYTTEELSSVRLDKNADVAELGAERGSKSHSLGRKVTDEEHVHHSTSTSNESDTSTGCEGRALWEPCEPRGQQTTMGIDEIISDGTSNVKELIDTYHGAPQPYYSGPSSGTLDERAAPYECGPNRGGLQTSCRETGVVALPGPVRCARDAVNVPSNRVYTSLAFQNVHPVTKTYSQGGDGVTPVLATKSKTVHWEGNCVGGNIVMPKAHVSNPEVGVNLDISKVRDVVSKDDSPMGLYDRDESGDGACPLVIQDPMGLPVSEYLSTCVGNQIGAKGENVELDLGNGKYSLAVAKSLSNSGTRRVLRSSSKSDSSSVVSNDVIAKSTTCNADLRDEASTTIRLANVTSEDTTRQARKRSLAIPVIYDSIIEKPRKQREKEAIRFEQLKNNDKEIYSANYKDYAW